MKCFYHNDLDGRCAGAIVSRYEKNSDSRDFFEVDYVMELPLDKIKREEKIYFVDYSFKKDTVWILEKLIKEMDCDVVWIDHHTSSLNLQREKDYAWLNSVDGIRQDGISGAGLTYMYLYQKAFADIPHFVKLVSDYDCWQFKLDKDTTHFKLGIETTDYNALDSIWGNLFDESCSDYQGAEVIRDLIGKGALIKGYIDKDNEQYRNSWGYETEINGIKCFAINRKSNSWIFGEKYNEYPVVMVYAFNGNKWSYSLFSSDKNIDCSKIAESFGGGGHKGAAGFSLDDMPFKISDLNI